MSLTQRHGQATFQAMAPVNTLDDTLLAGVLEAGGWSATADDDGGHERLPEGFVATIVREHATQPNAPSEKTLVGLGIMVLTLSVAEWGVAWETAPPPDPAAQKWQGPDSIRQGKHLMSYALGGIGLPHLDVGGAVRFFDAVAERVPAAKRDLDQLKAMPNGFRYDVVRAKGGVCAAPGDCRPNDGRRRRPIQARRRHLRRPELLQPVQSGTRYEYRRLAKAAALVPGCVASTGHAGVDHQRLDQWRLGEGLQ